jgi:hypothetical protein
MRRRLSHDPARPDRKRPSQARLIVARLTPGEAMTTRAASQ